MCTDVGMDDSLDDLRYCRDEDHDTADQGSPPECVRDPYRSYRKFLIMAI